MKTQQQNENFTEFRKMYLLYLQKFEKLTDKERGCFADYFNFVNKPTYIINTDIDSPAKQP